MLNPPQPSFTKGGCRKVLIIGAKGMLGQELVRVFLADKNYKIFGWDRENIMLSDSIIFEEVDITDEAQVKEKIRALAPDIIINAAAYNNVDKAEEPAEFEIAKKLNGLAPKFLAQAAKNLGAIFVHYSTDYVFDGQKEAGYKEDDTPSPISNYGRTKLMGEREVARVGGRYYIIRLQKLFGYPAQSASAKKSFFEMMLELARVKKELEVVDEELANFTYAPDLAERTKWLVETADHNAEQVRGSKRGLGAETIYNSSCPSLNLREGINSSHPNPFLKKEREKFPLTPLLQRGEQIPFGIYHITNEGRADLGEGAPATWFGAAKVLFEMAQRCHAEFSSASGSRNKFGMTKYGDIKLIPVPADKFPRPAKRPKYSILLNTKLPPLRPWPEALKEFLELSGIKK